MMKRNNFLLHPVERKDLIIALFLLVGVLILYIRTLAPDLLLGDSGEFQTLFYTMGMTHPTGYPIFVLFGRLFTLLPIGSLTWRANLFVAFQGALTIAMVYGIVRMLVGWRMAAVFSALSLAVMPIFWFYAVIAELYVPACLFSASVLFLVVNWQQSGNPHSLVLAGLAGGLSLGVHSTVALIAPAILIYLWGNKASNTAWKMALLGALMGLVLFVGSYAWLDAVNSRAGYYHASVEHALSTWGMSADQFDTFSERFRFMYFGKQFQSLMFADPQRVMQSNMEGMTKILQEAFLPGSLILVVIGFLLLFLQRWKENILFMIGGMSQIIFALNYEVYDYYVFFIPAFVFLAIWMGAGLGFFLTDITHILERRTNQAGRTASITNCLAVCIVVPILLLWSPIVVDAWQSKGVHFIVDTELDDYPYPITNPEIPHQQAQAMVASLEANAMVFTDWDMLFPYYFVSSVEMQNNEMDFYETYPQDEANGLAKSTVEWINQNLDRPIYFVDRPLGREAKKLNLIPVKKGYDTLYQVLGVE